MYRKIAPLLFVSFLLGCSGGLPEEGQVAQVKFTDLFEKNSEGKYSPKYPMKIEDSELGNVVGFINPNGDIDFLADSTIKVKNEKGVFVILSEPVS